MKTPTPKINFQNEKKSSASFCSTAEQQIMAALDKKN
jgi:hypothetical protein